MKVKMSMDQEDVGLTQIVRGLELVLSINIAKEMTIVNMVMHVQ